MDEDTVVEALESLEFTTYQARTYVAAAHLGSASPTDLADRADIPQSRIYDVIDDLHQMGLVEIREEGGSKTVYTPDPAMALEFWKNRRISDLSNSVQSTKAALERMYNSTEPTEQFITIVELRQTALRYIQQVIESATWWLSLALPHDIYHEVRPEIEAALDRGVNVRLVVPEEDSNTQAGPDTGFPDELQVRTRLLADTFALGDRQLGVYNSMEPRARQTYVVIREPNLVFQLQHVFEHFWPVSSIVQSPESYPRRYLDPWRGLRDLHPHLDEGEEFEVRITGYNNEEKRRGTWSGTIVDYELEGPVEADYTLMLPTKANLIVEVDGETLGVGGRRARQMELAADGLEVNRV